MFHHGNSFFLYDLHHFPGLLLHGDNTVQLVVLCAEKPTTSLLKRVVTELPIQLKKVAEEQKYTVTMAPVEGAVLVSDGTITVKISLTSPLLREGKRSLSNVGCKRGTKFANFRFIRLSSVRRQITISSYQFQINDNRSAVGQKFTLWKYYNMLRFV